MYAEPLPVSPENNTLMNWNAFAGLSEDDLSMLYEFFMTLPPVPYLQEPV